jgi:hypothetical protein
MCGAGILLKDSAVLQLHDVVLLDVVLLGHVVVGRVRQLEESGGRVRPEGQGPHGGCRARCALRNSFRSRFFPMKIRYEDRETLTSANQCVRAACFRGNQGHAVGQSRGSADRPNLWCVRLPPRGAPLGGATDPAGGWLHGQRRPHAETGT